MHQSGGRRRNEISAKQRGMPTFPLHIQRPWGRLGLDREAYGLSCGGRLASLGWRLETIFLETVAQGVAGDP